MKLGRPHIPARAREVLSYFLRNPKAADSLEGVARWRAPQETVRFTVEQVAHALSWLVIEGFLLEEDAPGVAPVYRLNPVRAADAELFLAERAKKAEMDPGGKAIEESRQMPPVVGWLDATLLQYLRENPPHAGDQPGLTRSPQSLEALLRSPLAAAPDALAAKVAGDEAAQTLADACRNGSDEEPLSAVCHNLGLTWLEFRALLLCLAPEIDVKYQIAFGVLNDEMSRRAPTLGLICRILGNPLEVRAELAGTGGLTRWRLVEGGAILPHADEPMRLDSTLVEWLLGDEEALLADLRLTSWLRLQPWPGGAWLTQEADRREIERLSQRFLATEPPSRWLALCGEDPDGWRALVEATAKATNSSLLRFVAAGASGGEPQDAQEAAALITRAALLLNAPVVFDLAAAGAEAEGAPGRASRVFEAVEEADRAGMVIAPEVERVLGFAPHEGWEVKLRGAPETVALAGAYRRAAEEAGLTLSPLDADQLAMAFPLPVSGIDSAARLALLEGAAERPQSEHAAALTSACRKVASPELPRYARRVRPSFGLDEVVLPPDRLRQLREMVAHVRYASRVLNTWGFSEKLPYGRGVAALFSGPSGTGKTMAAQAIAHELNTETYVVDLSRVISKYIGETEKFLDATFRDAQRAGAVLQIDEAEALFGKRSEIKDAHDRYANIEVAYLLQRMEAFDGCAILTTNLRQNLDQAFVRRLRFVIDFPKPDAAAREAIWRQCLPKGAPFRDIDIRFLARRLELTGGNIRQVTLRAAFAAAAEESETIEMRHLLAATRAELMKLGMPTADRDMALFEAERAADSERVA